MIVIPRLASLRVDGTQLQCKIEAEMWGAALTFEEVHLVNNYFDMVDNHAFFPFHTTLKVLNLGECQVGGRGNRSPSLGFCFFSIHFGMASCFDFESRYWQISKEGNICKIFFFTKIQFPLS